MAESYFRFLGSETFIPAVELTSKIATSLKGVGGAAHDYQELNRRVGIAQKLSCEDCAIE